MKYSWNGQEYELHIDWDNLPPPTTMPELEVKQATVTLENRRWWFWITEQLHKLAGRRGI